MKIRKAKIKDLNFLLKISKIFHNEHVKFDKFFYEPTKDYNKVTRKYFRSLIYSKNALFLVAEEDNKIIGYVIGNVANRHKIFKRRWRGTISDLYVIKKFRKQKVASKLTAELFKWFKLKKVHYVRLWVDGKNDVALQVYKKLGFKTFHIAKYKKI